MDIGTEETSPARIDYISCFKTRLPKRYKATFIVYSARTDFSPTWNVQKFIELPHQKHQERGATENRALAFERLLSFYRKRSQLFIDGLIQSNDSCDADDGKNKKSQSS